MWLHVVLGFTFCLYVNGANVRMLIDGTFHVSSTNNVHSTTYSDLTGNEQVKFNRLVSWITENGGFVDPRGVLATSNKSGYRGMFAVEDIPKDTILARIPRAVILKDTPEIVAFVERSGVGVNYVPGLLALASELVKGAESHWTPYLDMMPSIDGYLQFHPLAKIIALEDAEQRKTLTAPWAELVPGFANKLVGQAAGFDLYVQQTQAMNTKENMFDQKVFVRETIITANMIRQSRMWSEHGYLPIMDLFNHRNELYQVDLVEEDGAWLMVAKADIQAGDEIYDNYGIHDNQQLFGAWGFCDWTKTINYRRIPIDVHRADTAIGHAVDFMLKEQQKKVAGLFFLAHGGFTSAIHKLLRTSSLDARDLSVLMMKYPDDPTVMLDRQMVSLDNEAIVISKGIKLARILKADYPKTVEECKAIARESTDYVVTTLARICAEDLETLDGFEATVRKEWANVLEQKLSTAYEIMG